MDLFLFKSNMFNDDSLLKMINEFPMCLRTFSEISNFDTSFPISLTKHCNILLKGFIIWIPSAYILHF